MSYCVNCGVELDKDAAKCPLCQTPVVNPVCPVDTTIPPNFPVERREVEPVNRREAAVLLSGSLHIFTIEGEEPGTVAVSTGADAQQEPISMTGSVSGAAPVNSKLDETLNQSIEFIELSSRSINCLKSENINTVRDLVKMSEDDLKMIKNFGAKSMEEIKERLAEMKLSLGMKI